MQSGLDVAATGWLVVVLQMENKPDLETWIGLGDANSTRATHIDGFVEKWVVVTVEHGPHLVPFFIRRCIPSALPSVRSKLLGVLSRPTRDRERNATNPYNLDPCTLEPELHRL